VAPVDLLGPDGTGPLWGTESEDLNATLLVWPAGHEVTEHVNAELDVLLIALDGDAVITVDAEERPLAAGQALLIPKGTARGIRAGARGVRYLSVHRRRGRLQITDRP
jgi:quercetin dioxygenase-like cupin family protein